MARPVGLTNHTHNKQAVDLETAQRLLAWSRTIEEHGLTLREWEEREGLEPTPWYD